MKKKKLKGQKDTCASTTVLVENKREALCHT